MLTLTADRVHSSTSAEFNREIALQTERNVAQYARARGYEIDRRLEELDEEWDIERYLETMASSFTLVGLTLGITRSRKWLAIPAIVPSFFLQHALQGWCPPLPILRRLGVRTADEINQERYALKAMRGDFEEVTPQTALTAARRK
jgi:hypothetical protein